MSRGSFFCRASSSALSSTRNSQISASRVSPPRICHQVRPSVLSTRKRTTYRGVKNWFRTASSRLLRGAWLSSRICLPLVAAVEVLVDPTDRLVVAPDACELAVR